MKMSFLIYSIWGGGGMCRLSFFKITLGLYNVLAVQKRSMFIAKFPFVTKFQAPQTFDQSDAEGKVGCLLRTTMAFLSARKDPKGSLIQNEWRLQPRSSDFFFPFSQTGYQYAYICVYTFCFLHYSFAPALTNSFLQDYFHQHRNMLQYFMFTFKKTTFEPFSP